MTRTVTLAVAALLLATAADASAAPMRHLFSKLPTGARTAIAIDIKKLRESKHFDGAMGVIESIDELASVRLGAESGLHPRGDIDALALVVMADGDGVAALEGKKLDKAKVRSYLKKRAGGKFEEETVHGRTLLGGGKGPSVAFLSDTVAIVGPPRLVKKALATAVGKHHAVFKAGGLTYLLEKAETDAPLWAIGSITPKDRELLQKSGRGVVAGITRYFMRGDLTNGLVVKTTAGCTSAEACGKLREKIQGELDAIKAKTALRLLGVTSYIEKIAVAQQEDHMTLDLSLDDASLSTLLAVGPRVYSILR
jgi:hypothetical protein